ncbi:glycosyltransferase family 2 protein [Alteromonas sediminis]|uniref:Glycosyltransferase family 2 protein n=1 Tax=Alteromonas sediminis TaxID=2259342 RepID=A0A3N5Y4E9_9ALTE|nr:glycosyltransferase family A protein [Alteromonas sediminis]RPJ64979.1 glycosyltransferase family 2 protein [Alteromonas sediminis]
MKVSVIVPVYNLEHYVGPCLEGLVRQKTSFDFEVIVANDCSTDASLSVINSYLTAYPYIIKVIEQRENKGLAANMLKLLSSATGEYIAYVDGDDMALPGKLQLQADYLDNNPDCSMVYHESEVFDSQSGNITGHYVADYYNHKYIPDKADITHLIRYGSFFQASSLMLRNHPNTDKTVDAKCKIILDQPFQILNAGYLGGSIGRIDKILGQYRIHPDSFGAKTLKDYARREQVLRDQLQAISHGADFYIEQSCIEQGQAHYYLATAMYFLKLGEISLFNKYISLSAQTDWRFDKRHEYLVENRSDVEGCLRVLS